MIVYNEEPKEELEEEKTEEEGLPFFKSCFYLISAIFMKLKSYI